MAWIKIIQEDEATGKVGEFYEELKKSVGGVPNIVKVNSLHPSLMEAQFNYFRLLVYGHSPLSRARREMVALVVSAKNQCHY